MSSWREWNIGSLAFWIQGLVFLVLSYYLAVKAQMWALLLILFLLWYQVYLKKSW